MDPRNNAGLSNGTGQGCPVGYTRIGFWTVGTNAMTQDSIEIQNQQGFHHHYCSRSSRIPHVVVLLEKRVGRHKVTRRDDTDRVVVVVVVVAFRRRMNLNAMGMSSRLGTIDQFSFHGFVGVSSSWLLSLLMLMLWKKRWLWSSSVVVVLDKGRCVND